MQWQVWFEWLGYPVFSNTPAPSGKGIILLHGRGAGAGDMQALYQQLPVNCWCLTPQANHPQLSWFDGEMDYPWDKRKAQVEQAMQLLDKIIEKLNQSDVSLNQVLLAGFSQGGCLTAEFLLTRGGRLAAAAVLSGAVLNPEVQRFTGKDLGQTPVLIGVGQQDWFISLSQAQTTAKLLDSHQAKVDLRLYPQMGHTINPDELAWLSHQL